MSAEPPHGRPGDWGRIRREPRVPAEGARHLIAVENLSQVVIRRRP